MAGESALRAAQNGRAKAERLAARGVDTASLGMWAENQQKGADGESAVAADLANLGPGWVRMNDRRRAADTQANIDHILVGPPGVVVIDAKNWAAPVSLDSAGALRSGGYSKQGSVLAAASDAERIAAELRSAGLVVPVHAAVCFVNGNGLEGPVHTTSGAVLVPLNRLRFWLGRLPQHDLPVDQVASLVSVQHPCKISGVETLERARRRRRTDLVPAQRHMPNARPSASRAAQVHGPSRAAVILMGLLCLALLIGAIALLRGTS